MLIVLGRYRFRRRTIAYRGDHCLSCDCPTVSEQQRTFDVFHVYYIPCLPLGFRKHWHCGQCGEDPHQRVQTSRTFKILGLCAFSFIAALFWWLPIERPEDATMTWVFRIGGTCVALFFLLLIVLHRRTVPLSEKLGVLPRLTPESCLACGEPLYAGAPRCPNCEVEYL